MICLQILLDLSERALYGGRNLTSAPTLVTSSTTWSTWWIDALSTITMELEFWPLICRTNSKNWYRHLPLLQLKESQLQNNACLWGSRCVLMGVVLECHSHTFKAHFFDHTQSHHTMDGSKAEFSARQNSARLTSDFCKDTCYMRCRVIPSRCTVLQIVEPSTQRLVEWYSLVAATL